MDIRRLSSKLICLLILAAHILTLSLPIYVTVHSGFFFSSCSSYTSQLDLTGKQLKIAALNYNEKSVRVLMESGTN